MRGYSVFVIKKCDKEIKGTAREIAYKLDLNDAENVYTASRTGHKLKGYTVEKQLDYVYTEDENAHNRYIDKQRERTKQKYEEHKNKVVKRTKADNLNYLKKHFIDYGYKSCYCKFDPFPYLPDLYDLGVDCKAREWVSYPERYNLTKQHRSKKPRLEGYIVEVQKRWTTKPSPTI